MRDPLEGKFLAALRGLLAADAPGGGGLLVACSGGADSVALAALCAAARPLLDFDIALAHLDHRLRPDSAADAEFTAALARKLGLHCRVEELPLPERLAAEGGNVEARARELRYAALERIAREQGQTFVLTGHHAGDLAETLWLWLLRGSGLRGLSPLKASRPISPGSPIRVLRPLLGFGRDELCRYLERRGIAWREDITNNDLDLRRNRIRHRLLPMLRDEFGLDPMPAAARLATQAGEIGEYLDTELAERGFPPGKNDIWSVKRADLNSLPPALAGWLLSRELGRLGEADAEAQAGLLAFCRDHEGSGGLDLPGGVRAELSGDRLILRPRNVEAPPSGLPALSAHLDGAALPLPPAPENIAAPDPGGASDLGTVPNLGTTSDSNPMGTPNSAADPDDALTQSLDLGDGWRLTIRRAAGPVTPPGDAWGARFDNAALALPLRLTRSKPGLRVRPLGGPGSRKLTEIFIDRKVPRDSRADWPLLLDGDGAVLWVPGVLRCAGAAIEDGSRDCLCLDLERISS